MNVIRFEPFQWQDLQKLRDIQEKHHHTYELALSCGSRMQQIENSFSWTAWDGDQAIACCGITDCCTWAFLSCDLRKDMLAITRQVQRVLRIHYVTRPHPIYADIDINHPAAVRWAKLLGFQPHEDNEPNVWQYPHIL